MEKGRLFHLVFILVLGASFIPSVMGEEESLASLVPEKTSLFVSFPSLRRAWEGFTTLPLYEAYQDEEVQGFLKTFGTDLDEILPGVRIEFVKKLLDLPEIFDGEAAFALISEKEGAGDEFEWAFTLSWESESERAPVFVEEVLIPVLKSMIPGGSKDEEIQGRKVSIYQGPAHMLYIARVGRRMLFTGSEWSMNDLLRRLDGSSDSLAESDTFRSACAQCGASDASFLLFLNIGELMTRELEEAKEEERKALAAAGFDEIRSLAAGLTMKEGRADDKIWLDVPGVRKGMLDIFSDSPVDIELSRLAPENTLLFLAANVGIRDFYQTILAIDEASPHSPLREFRASADELSQELGLRSFSDLVGQLGTEVFLFAALPKGGGFFPELAAAVEVLEPDKLQTNLFALVRTLTGEDPNELSFKGRKIYYVPLESRNILDQSVCWCATDGYLLVGLHPTVLKGVIRRFDQSSRSLRKDAEFEAAWKKLPAGAPAVAYANSRHLFNYLYGLILPFATMLDDEMPFDPAALPTAEAVEVYLSFGLSGLKPMEGGIRLQTDSDGYGPTSFVMYGLIAAFFFYPVEAWNEAVRRWPACGYQMETIFEGLEEFRRDRSRYPERLEEMAVEENWRFSGLACPVAHNERSERPGYKEERGEGLKDFVYIVAVKGMEPPDSFPRDWMIVWDSEPRHNGGRIVLLGSGQVIWLTEEAFQERWKEQGE